jgi:hypothetical protein
LNVPLPVTFIAGKKMVLWQMARDAAMRLQVNVL